MEKKPNALLIGDSVEMTYVDFSSYEGLKESTGFKKLYTIHTQETLNIGNKIGLHIGGFCDDYGTGGGYLAGKISGYGSLPSDLILCLMDDKYNFLPLSERQLQVLYVYLTEGKVLPLTDDEASLFFTKHNITPILPNFHISRSIELFDDYPEIIVLRYDLNELKNDKDYEKFGQELFYFSDKIVTKAKHYCDGVNVDLEHTYYLHSEKDGNEFIVFIEVYKGQEPKIGELSFRNRLLHKSVEDTGDVIEEVKELFDEDEEDTQSLLPYLLIVEVNAIWPRYKYTKVSYKLAYPIFLMEGEEANNISFPYFNEAFEITGIDRIHDVLSLRIKTGKQFDIDLEVDEERVIDFEYQSNPEKETSFRTGTLKFRFEKHDFDYGHLPGRIEIYEGTTNVTKRRIDLEDSGVIKKVKFDDSVDPLFLFDDVISHTIFMLDEANQFVVLVRRDHDDNENRYIPLKLGEENLYCDQFFSDDDQSIIKDEVEISYKI